MQRQTMEIRNMSERLWLFCSTWISAIRAMEFERELHYGDFGQSFYSGTQLNQ